jgi:hypothetical protein
MAFPTRGSALALLLCASSSALASAGSIAGTVTFLGPLPTPAPLDRSAEPGCSQSLQLDQALLVSPQNRGLANVVVSVIGGPAQDGGPAPVVFHQRDCTYLPRVQAAVHGQPVEVVNEDRVLHDVHAYAGRRALFNLPQPPGRAPVVAPIPAGTEVLRLRCDVHGWMIGWVVYGDSPFTAVTTPAGIFEIHGLPPGTYTLRAWHETLGTREAQIRVTDGATAQARFAFQAPPAK